MNNNTESDPGFRFRFLSSVTPHNIPDLPSSSSNAANYDPKPWKKRSKLIKMDVRSGSSTVSNSKRKYTKRTDPCAAPPCSECGKKFWSWKALFGHMRCHPERQWRGINPPPNYCRMTEEDGEVAASLLMLANGNQGESEKFSGHLGGENLRFQCWSCNKVSRQRASGHKCSICWRVFSSGQALGGHKRCHWDKGDDTSLNLLAAKRDCGLELDLNSLPPIPNHPSSTLALDLRLGL